MAARLSGIAYGPGFSTQGTPVEFDISDYGLRMVTADDLDGAPPWSEVGIRRLESGTASLLLEWAGRSARYALSVSDPEAMHAIANRAAPDAAVRIARPAGPARELPRGMVWTAIVLAAALLGLAWAFR